MRIDFPELAQQASDLWERNAGWWDEQMGEGNVWHQTLASATERLLALREGERVIDLACGNGQFARRMAQFGAHVTAVDVSESMLDAARERSGSKTVVACITLVLRATARALRPAGRFVFSIPHPCFNTNGTTMLAERDDYATSRPNAASAFPDSRRRTTTSIVLAPLFGACFTAGFALDGLEEPCAESGANGFKARRENCGEIPSILVARMTVR